MSANQASFPIAVMARAAASIADIDSLTVRGPSRRLPSARADGVDPSGAPRPCQAPRRDAYVPTAARMALTP